MMTRHK